MHIQINAFIVKSFKDLFKKLIKATLHLKIIEHFKR